ncbi:MAG: helix-turn-helix domain-containing protein [Isosphaeraceae bacterium]
MEQVKSLAEWMADRGVGLADLVEGSGLDGKVIEAIAANRYTPSPQQRQRLAAAVGVALEQIVWGHAAPVEHVYGHGPQFGRSP